MTIDTLTERMGDALFSLSDSLRSSGFLGNAEYGRRYEAVVTAWCGLTHALAAAARKGRDVEQARGEAPQSGGDSRNAQNDQENPA